MYQNDKIGIKFTIVYLKKTDKRLIINNILAVYQYCYFLKGK